MFANGALAAALAMASHNIRLDSGVEIVIPKARGADFDASHDDRVTRRRASVRRTWMHGMSARRMGLNFIARGAATNDVSRAVESFRGTVAAFGFEGAFCGAWAADSHRLFFSDWPQTALDPLLQSELFRNDLDEARRRLMPFTWADASSHRAKAGIALHPAVRAQSWTDGLIVPMHGPFGYLGLVVLASRQRVDAPPSDRAILHVMAVTVHERCRSAIVMAYDAPLTRRERECLRWVAAGKSDRDIAKHLGVSAATAHYHVERAKKKLGVNSRSHAVAMLLLEGEL